MTTDIACLELYFINAGVGESIIIHLPNKKWGVVDCYAPSITDPDTNPTLEFLLRHKVENLEFLCLTHPHDDHYRGMSQILEKLPTKYFWRFGSLLSSSVVKLLFYLKYNAIYRSDDNDLENANDLDRTLAIVSERRRLKKLSVKHMSDIKPLYPQPISIAAKKSPLDSLEIWSIAPSANQIENYEEKLYNFVKSYNFLKNNMPNLRHNSVSAALLIKYGKTRVVLGGDVEIPNWTDTLSSLSHNELASHIVKVSHHGSTTGYTPNLWTIFSAQGKPYAIIMPYKKYDLPKFDAVQHIKIHSHKMISTCLSAISFPTSINDIQYSQIPEVQAIFKDEFSSPWADQPRNLGICLLKFDQLGNCIHEGFYGRAGYL